MNIHFISIGGSVMHQLAIALKRKGYHVTGSDDDIFEPARTNLEKEGLLPEKMGWNADAIHDNLDAVILGMHARADNPELQRAQELHLPIYSFPEYIYKESKEKKRVVVGGSHGKTTTTAMIMHVLRASGKDFDYLVGARLEGFDQSVNITNAPLIVCEGDEYPASTLEKKPKFHFLYPHIAVLTGIAWDHINVFPTFENYLEQFAIFISRIEKGGVLIYNESDGVLKKLVEENKRADIQYQPYGVPQHDIKNHQTTLEIEGCKTGLQVFGNHNLLNLHAAWFVCKALGIEAKDFVKAIATFTGAAKRLEKIAASENTIVYRDFAHAPSKARATIEAVKEQYPDKKLVAIFELHTFSSLSEAFLSEYKGVMDGVDAAAVYFSKHALEIKRMPQLDTHKIKEGFANNAIEVLTDKAALETFLKAHSAENAVILFMSSGNYDGFDLESFAKKATLETA